ncbi:MAG: hypothetical protein FAZ92_02369 [Accumulibacter sp.]|nr:MAG: hypothetical protein FAZ92_02369 [Accumulibacter sp.]
MRRDRVAREGVDGEQVEFLRRFAFEHQAAVSEHRLDARAALRQVAEVAAREVEDLVVDFVQPHFVALAAVDRERAGAKSKDADLARPVGGQAEQRLADSRLFAVVGGRPPAVLGGDELLAVVDAAVQDFALDAEFVLADVGDAQLAVEVAHDTAVFLDVIDPESRQPVAVEGEGDEQQPAPDPLDFRPEDYDHQHGAEEEADRQLEVGVEQRRREQADETAAERAADRQHQVEQRQVAHRWPPPHQLAMTDHAEDEEREAKEADQHRYRHADFGENLVERDERDRQRDQETAAMIVAWRIEAENEAQQVDAQRHHPQERHRRDVLRQVTGQRQQEDRGRHRQADPQQALAQRRPRHGLRTGRAAFEFAGDALPRLPGAGEAGDHEEDVADRPGVCLLHDDKERFDEHRIGEQREHRRQVRQRVEAIRHQAVERPRIPRLHQRPGGRQQQVRHADGGSEDDEHIPRRAGEGGVLPGRIGDHRQRRQTEQQQHAVHDVLPARRKPLVQQVHVEVAEQQRRLKEDHAGGPHRRRTAEPRQDHLGDDRLDLEEEKGRKEDRHGEADHPGVPGCCGVPVVGPPPSGSAGAACQLSRGTTTLLAGWTTKCGDMICTP